MAILHWEKTDIMQDEFAQPLKAEVSHRRDS